MAFSSSGGPSTGFVKENFSMSNYGPAAVPTSVAVAFTATVATQLRSLRVANPTAGGFAGGLDVTLHLVPSGGTAGAGNVLTLQTLATKTSAEICVGGCPIVMEAGDSIHALGSGAGLLLFASIFTER